MTVVATAVAHVRSVRAEVEAARAVAIDLSGRPIEAGDLHAVDIWAAAETRDREEDSTWFL